MIYREYITSDLWKKRKQNYFKTHDRKCKACGSLKRIHLHHKTYRRLGEERDADLVPLCHVCHTSLHRQQKKSGENLWIATENFIRNKRKHKFKKIIKKSSITRKRGMKRLR